MSTDRRQLLPGWVQALAQKTPFDILAWAASEFPGQLVFGSSLGLEDQVITDIIARRGLPVPIFTLDTGRLFQESFNMIARTEEKYNLKITVLVPDHDQVEAMVRERGVNLFRRSIEDRRECCRVRKIEPLRRALSGQQAWVTGLRRGQAVTRADVDVVEWDESNQLFKINPLAAWSLDEVRAYIDQNKVPYNPLHDEGYPTIGCACCTRAIEPGEDVRAGRWWWEQPEHKECGLHGKDGERLRKEVLQQQVVY